MRRERHGFHLILLAALMPALAWLAGGILFTRSRASLRDVSRVGNTLLARDLIGSVMAEATHEFMTQVNDPSQLLFARIREALEDTPVEFQPALVHARRQLASQAAYRLVAATVMLTSIAPIPGIQGMPGWTGIMRVEVRMSGAGTESPHWVGRQDRQITSDFVGIPPGFDLPGMVDLAGSPLGSVRLPVAPWLERASLRIEADAGGKVQERYEFLRDRLGALNGVVLVGDEESGPLTLRSVRHRGKTVLVTRGPLTLADVTLDDPARDCLTILAFGPVHLEGEVEARILISDPAEGRLDTGARIERSLAGGTHLRGSLIIASGDVEVGRGFAVDPSRSAQEGGASGDEEVVNLHRLYVSVSPTLLDTRVEVVP